MYVTAPSRFNFGPFCVPFNGQSWDIAIWAIGDCGENYLTVLLIFRREERNFQWEVAVIDWAYIGLFVMFMSSCTIPIIHADLIKWIAFWSLNFWRIVVVGGGRNGDDAGSLGNNINRLRRSVHCSHSHRGQTWSSTWSQMRLGFWYYCIYF